MIDHVFSVYLAHPYSKRAEAKEYQQQLADKQITAINPFDRPEQAIYERALATTGLTHAMCAEIVNMDIEKIDQADGLVALLIGTKSIGTLMEIFYAGYVKNLPVWIYVVSEQDKKHPWLRYCGQVHDNFESLLRSVQLSAGLWLP